MKPGLYNLEQQLKIHESMWADAKRRRDRAMADISHHARRIAQIKREINEGKDPRRTREIQGDSASDTVSSHDHPTIRRTYVASEERISLGGVGEHISPDAPQKETEEPEEERDSQSVACEESVGTWPPKCPNPKCGSFNTEAQPVTSGGDMMCYTCGTWFWKPKKYLHLGGCPQCGWELVYHIKGHNKCARCGREFL